MFIKESSMSRINFTEFAGSFSFNGAPEAAPKSEATRTLAGLMLAGVMAAMLVVADQVIDNWADGHLLLGWVALWSVVFAGLAFFARPLRKITTALAASVDRQMKVAEQIRREEQMWEFANRDPRVMEELRAAVARAS
jgi:hypothetical protein